MEYIDIEVYGILMHTTRRRGLYYVKGIIRGEGKLSYELEIPHSNSMIVGYDELVSPGGRFNYTEAGSMMSIILGEFFPGYDRHKDPLGLFLFKLRDKV